MWPKNAVHEVGICADVIAAVLGRAAGRVVARVRIRAGVRHEIVPETFQEAFALVADGTVAAAAVVDLELEPVTLTCCACGHRTQSEDPAAPCRRCGSRVVRRTGGDSLTVVSVSFR